VLKPGDRFFDARPLAGWYPPYHEIMVFKMLKPFGTTIVTLRGRAFALRRISRLVSRLRGDFLLVE
jgi:hypothetical protein